MVTNNTEENYISIFCPEEGGNFFLRNVVTTKITTQYHKRRRFDVQASFETFFPYDEYLMNYSEYISNQSMGRYLEYEAL